jgi:hypothetical protein
LSRHWLLVSRLPGPLPAEGWTSPGVAVGPFAATALPGVDVAVTTILCGVGVAVGFELRASLILEPKVAPRITSTMIAAKITGITHRPRGEDWRCTLVIVYSLQIECAPPSMQ